MNAAPEIYRRAAVLPLFRGCSENEILDVLLSLYARPRKVARGETLYNEGAEAQSIAVVLNGRLEEVQSGADASRVQVIRTLTFGDLFGAALVASPVTAYPATLRALEASEVLQFDLQQLIRMREAERNLKFFSNLLEAICYTSYYLWQKVKILSCPTIAEKVVAGVRLLQELFCEEEIELPFGRQGFADYLGVNRSALSRTMSDMQASGRIVFKGRRIRVVR